MKEVICLRRKLQTQKREERESERWGGGGGGGAKITIMHVDHGIVGSSCKISMTDVVSSS